MTDTATYTLASNADYVDKPICSATGCDDDANVASAKTIGDVRVWVYACYTHSVYIGDRFATLHDDGFLSALEAVGESGGKAMANFARNMGEVIARYQRESAIARDGVCANDGEGCDGEVAESAGVITCWAHRSRD